MKNLGSVLLVVLIGTATGAITIYSEGQTSVFALVRGAAFGNGILLLLFGFGGFLGRIPSVIRLRRKDQIPEVYMQELTNLCVFGLSMISGIAVLLGAVILFGYA